MIGALLVLCAVLEPLAMAGPDYSIIVPATPLALLSPRARLSRGMAHQVPVPQAQMMIWLVFPWNYIKIPCFRPVAL